MNKYRRKLVNELMEILIGLKGKIEDILQEEQDYFDNMPENLQCGQRGENSEEAISNLEDAISNLEDGISSLECVIEN